MPLTFKQTLIWCLWWRGTEPTTVHGCACTHGIRFLTHCTAMRESSGSHIIHRVCVFITMCFRQHGMYCSCRGGEESDWHLAHCIISQQLLSRFPWDLVAIFMIHKDECYTFSVTCWPLIWHRHPAEISTCTQNKLRDCNETDCSKSDKLSLDPQPHL